MNNPCEGCGAAPRDGRRCKYEVEGEAGPVETSSKDCVEYQRYLGYQEGLEQAESLVHQREREIVEWLKNEFETGSQPWHITQRLSEWVGLEGK